MKRLLLTLLALLSMSPIWAKECKITCENEHFLMVIMDTNFKSITPGSVVPEGTPVFISLSCDLGYTLQSFLINGVEHKQDLGDYDGEGRNFQYRYVIQEDTHFEAISAKERVPVLFVATGDGHLEVKNQGQPLEPGDQVEYGSKIAIKVLPSASQELLALSVNGQNYLEAIKNNEMSLELTIYTKTVIRATFSGQGTLPEEQEFAITWSAMGEGNIQVKCGTKPLSSGDKVLKGDYIDVTLVPDEGYQLESFYINGSDRLKDLENYKLTLQVREALDIQAQFAKKPTESLWLDHAASSYAGGNGTESAPYQIATAEQLARIAKEIYNGMTNYRGVHFELIADIDLAGSNWYPIGFNDETLGIHPFEGKLTGNHFQIRNLSIKPIAGHSSLGLFGATGQEAEIRNLTIESGSVIGTTIVGGFVGYNCGIIENCVNKAYIGAQMFFCGGIAGLNTSEKGASSSGVIRRCQNLGIIEAGAGESVNGISAGGICGSNSALIEECINWARVYASLSGAGGITALLEGGEIRHCINRGTIESSEQVGGIIGSSLGRTGDCQIYNCYSASTLRCQVPKGDGAILGVAMFTDKSVLKVSDCYYDRTLYTGAATGSITDYFGTFELTNLMGLETSEMKNPDFVSRLNKESKGGEKWTTDNQDIINGYPILRFLEQAKGAALMSPKTTDTVRILTANGRICLEGVASSTFVQILSLQGVPLYTGRADALAAHIFPPAPYLVTVDGQAYKVLLR